MHCLWISQKSVASEDDVLGHDDVKTDVPPAKPCPVPGTTSPNAVDTVDTAAGTVLDSGQPPEYVTEIETVSPPTYVNVDTVEIDGKCKKSVTFGADLVMCKDDGVMINTCAQLDESILFTPDVLDEGDTEKSF